ncbi:MAG: MFS transporter [Pseudomonadota bacterium]
MATRAGEVDTPGELSMGARHYALGILVVVYTFNFIDRQILSILLPSIKAEMLVSDMLLGLLAGGVFAVFYATLGVPIALYADRGNRRNLIALALAVWSGMTALCGLAQNFWQLAAARIGVAVGEAGCSPPAHSMISDYYPPERRATALSIYSLGIPLGIMFGLMAGGWVNEYFGWRRALLVVGLPGLLLALVVRFTVKEPPRGLSERRVANDDRPSMARTFRFLMRRRSFMHLALGAGLAAFSGYAIANWFPTYLTRSHGMTSGQIGMWLGLILGIPGGLGIFLGGYLADRIGARDSRWRMWVVVIALIAMTPFQIVAFLSDDRLMVLLMFIVPVVLGNFYQATCFAQTQNLVDLRMRGTAAALLLFIINIIGLGAGPPVAGLLSDAFNQRFGDEAMRYSLLVISMGYVWAALHLYIAGRHLPGDLARARDPD